MLSSTLAAAPVYFPHQANHIHPSKRRSPPSTPPRILPDVVALNTPDFPVLAFLGKASTPMCLHAHMSDECSGRTCAL